MAKPAIRTGFLGRPLANIGPGLLLAAACLWPVAAYAQGREAGKEAIDTEHIFGFTEGSDIGEKGEQEAESTTVGYFGSAGRYTAIGNESAYRNVLLDGFRLSFMALPDYHSIHGMPHLADRNSVALSGAASELRWQLSDRSKLPIGFSIALVPELRWIDGLSGAWVESYALPVVVAADTALIPDKLYAAFNFAYAPEIARAQGKWEHSTEIEVSGAMSYAITPGVFVGGELRYIASEVQDSTLSRGLFAGPSLFVQLSKTASVKVAWSGEIAEETPRGPGLANFGRNQAILLFVRKF